MVQIQSECEVPLWPVRSKIVTAGRNVWICRSVHDRNSTATIMAALAGQSSCNIVAILGGVLWLGICICTTCCATSMYQPWSCRECIMTAITWNLKILIMQPTLHWTIARLARLVLAAVVVCFASTLWRRRSFLLLVVRYSNGIFLKQRLVR